jgi:hypothetical protein
MQHLPVWRLSSVYIRVRADPCQLVLLSMLLLVTLCVSIGLLAYNPASKSGVDISNRPGLGNNVTM